MKKFSSIKNKLFRSHLSVALTGILMLFVLFHFNVLLEQRSSELISHADPYSIYKLQKIKDGIGRANMALHSWISLHDNAYKTKMKKIWKETIWLAHKEIEAKKKLWFDSNELSIVSNLSKAITQLYTWQWYTADIANSPGNLPTNAFFENYVLPVSENIIKTSNDLLHMQHNKIIEGESESNLLKIAELSTHSLKYIKFVTKYISEGSPAWEYEVKKNLKEQRGIIKQIDQHLKSMDENQRELNKWLKNEVSALIQLTETILKLRKKEDWNVAVYILEKNIIPISTQIKKYINVLIKTHDQKIMERASTIENTSLEIMEISFILLITMIIVSFYISNKSAKQIMTPINMLIKANSDFASGKSNRPVPITNNDEFRLLTIAFNKMKKSLVEKQKSLEQLATYDKLTGIANRRKFDMFISDEWNRAIRNNTAISLLLIDIDFFKQYNDNYGHQSGDDCLKKVGKLLSHSVNRLGDLPARYGGEEFAVVLPYTDNSSALKIADKINKAIEQLKIEHKYSTASRFVTASIGVATLHANKSQSPEDLIKQADKALYNAKSKGRNCVADSLHIHY